MLRKISVWGCGNFECWWPRRIFGNRRAEREGRLEVHPWADDRPDRDRDRPGAILQSNWREKFAQFAGELGGANLYITIDLDCLRPGDALTNWENGRFTLDDVAWAVTQLQASAQIVGGDICGAYSLPKYARAKQRFAAEMDHPKISVPNIETAHEVNRRAFDTLWPLLGGSSAPPLDL